MLTKRIIPCLDVKAGRVKRGSAADLIKELGLAD